jgi:hypothetical protein
MHNNNYTGATTRDLCSNKAQTIASLSTSSITPTIERGDGTQEVIGCVYAAELYGHNQAGKSWAAGGSSSGTRNRPGSHPAPTPSATHPFQNHLLTCALASTIVLATVAPMASPRLNGLAEWSLRADKHGLARAQAQVRGMAHLLSMQAKQAVWAITRIEP